MGLLQHLVDVDFVGDEPLDWLTDGGHTIYIQLSDVVAVGGYQALSPYLAIHVDGGECRLACGVPAWVMGEA